jgi:ribosomal protein S18 acetylase RimI-like enzyme
MPERHKRIADMVRQRLGMKVKKFTSRKEIKEQYGQAIFDLFNEAYDSLYGYSPLNDRQIEKYIKDYLGLLNLDLVTLIVDKDDQLVGVGVSMPSMSRALQKSKGRLFPFGWIHLLKGLKGKNDRVDLLMVAVKPQYQNKGVNALLFDDLIPQYIKYGFKQAESNPELALNDKVQSQWQNFPNTQHRQRVAFVKNI